MDLNKIFDNFDDDESQNIPTKQIVEEWKYSPAYKIGMFKKIVSNYSFIKDLFVKKISNSELEIDEKEMEEAGEFVTYSRAWDHIKECDLEDEIWKFSLISNLDSHLVVSLDMSIHYFEGEEEYEKCAFLIKIKNFLKDSLDSQD